jgi:serine O-acetyltransferase
MNHDRLVDAILAARRAHPAVLPDRDCLHRFIEDLVELLFPHFAGGSEYVTRSAIEKKLESLADDLRQLLGPLGRRPGTSPLDPDRIAARLFGDLPEIYRKLWLDAEAIHEGDPAAESLDEVIAAYPGFFAIYAHRIAHALHVERVPILPRSLAEYAHVRTGIDIHPGAHIGERFCIDHGTGIVIGQTAVIGTRVKIYQGVSLGAMSVAKAMAGAKRHPTIEENVVVYSNATILGGNTTIGHDSVIGGNVWLTESVPPHSVVQHRSDVRVRSRESRHQPIDFVI